MEDNELKHWGVKGMKWGVRRNRRFSSDTTPGHLKRTVKDRTIVGEAKRLPKDAKVDGVISTTPKKRKNSRKAIDPNTRVSDTKVTAKSRRGRKVATGIIAGSLGVAAAGALLWNAEKLARAGLLTAVGHVLTEIKEGGPL